MGAGLGAGAVGSGGGSGKSGRAAPKGRCVWSFATVLLQTRMDPIVNLEETPGKVLGKRRPPADPLLSYMRSPEEARRWKLAFVVPGIPKGLYRFRTHEEADTWLWRMMTRKRS